MTEIIKKWLDIKNDYIGSTILLGNGASIAVDSRFSYTSLLNHAKDNHLTHDIQTLFKFFDTSDFELILRLVWQASNVNDALNISDKKTYEAYQRVRESLIKSVRDVHPEHEEVSENFPIICDFLKQFETVLSLSYDLILYWTIMYSNENNSCHTFKDCFINSVFDNDWKRLRKPIPPAKCTSLVFYPHGNLILGRNVIGEECKIATNDNSDLLDTILNQWKLGKNVPLFVSEGTSKRKLNSIHSSYYLSSVYWEVLTNIQPNLVIYGWSCGEHDEHILKAISRSNASGINISSIAISVHKNDQNYCNEMKKKITKFFNGIQIDFFDSESPGCWNNQKQQRTRPKRKSESSS